MEKITNLRFKFKIPVSEVAITMLHIWSSSFTKLRKSHLCDEDINFYRFTFLIFIQTSASSSLSSKAEGSIAWLKIEDRLYTGSLIFGIKREKPKNHIIVITRAQHPTTRPILQVKEWATSASISCFILSTRTYTKYVTNIVTRSYTYFYKNANKPFQRYSIPFEVNRSCSFR